MIWREEKRRKWESQRYNAFAISRCYEHKNKLVEHLSIWLSLFFLHLYVSRYYKVDDDKKNNNLPDCFFKLFASIALEKLEFIQSKNKCFCFLIYCWVSALFFLSYLLWCDMLHTPIGLNEENQIPFKNLLK